MVQHTVTELLEDICDQNGLRTGDIMVDYKRSEIENSFDIDIEYKLLDILNGK